LAQICRTKDELFVPLGAQSGLESRRSEPETADRLPRWTHREHTPKALKIQVRKRMSAKGASCRVSMESHRFCAGWARESGPMRLSPVESVLLAACVVMAVVVVYWGLKILVA
jgi:hypothetical protein